MTRHEIIQSGLLEAYAMGQLTGQEARSVESALASDVSLRAELDRIERALEQAAMEQAVAPPPEVRARILSAIRQAPREPKLVGMALRSAPGRARSWLAIAASIALLASIGLNVVMLLRLREAHAELARLQEERSVLAEQVNVQRASLEDAGRKLAVLSDPGRKVVTLAGTAAAPEALARVYWDQGGNSVHLDVLRLPAPPVGKQYQLWAIADGQPVDAGLVPLGDAPDGLLTMKAIASAQAFAVTLEDEGGKPAPTLERMVLIGRI
jgi:anti-sigma-K factor RskA